MSNLPWAKFYWADWMSDARLRRCSIAARGLWIDMLCIAAELDPIGYLAMDGEALSISDFARASGITETDASTLIAELERNGVFSRDRKGVIYSRRMVRDAKRSAEAKKNGKLGGNPNLGKQTENSAEDNPKLNGSHKPPDKPQKPSSISHEANLQQPSLLPREAVRGEDLESVLRKAAGWSHVKASGLSVTGPIEELLKAGADLDLDVLAVVQAKAPEAKYKTSWNFFVGPIRDAMKARLEAKGAVVSSDGLAVLKKGTPEFKAYIAKLRSEGKKTMGYERMETITVPLASAA